MTRSTASAPARRTYPSSPSSTSVLPHARPWAVLPYTDGASTGRVQFAVPSWVTSIALPTVIAVRVFGGKAPEEKQIVWFAARRRRRALDGRAY